MSNIEIKATVELQEPIEGVNYSKNAFILSATKTIPEDKERLHKAFHDMVQTASQIYYEKLKKEVQKSRNDLIDKLRGELDDKYREKFKLAKEEIIKLRKQIK